MKRVRRKRPRAGDVERGRGNGGCFCGEFIVDGELCRLGGRVGGRIARLYYPHGTARKGPQRSARAGRETRRALRWFTRRRVSSTRGMRGSCVDFRANNSSTRNAAAGERLSPRVSS